MICEMKKLSAHAIVPTRGSDKAAGFDVYACIDNDVIITPGTNAKIPIGWSMTAPEGYFIGIYARSGMAAKRGLRPANCVGIVDEDYTGPIIVALYNDSDENQIIHDGDRIAQIIFQKYNEIQFKEVEELNITNRGDGGFGSTGSN